MDLSGYRLEPLHKDGELILYRGARPTPADGAPSSVLVVGPAGEYASPATLARLEHEYSLASELDPRWVARPIALGRHQGRTVLALEDPGGEPLSRLLGKPMGVGAFLDLAIGLAHTVGRLHASGLIHKDIKPTDVLVDSATGEVWLTGLGIASRLRRERQSPEPPEIIAGTLAYMAPEQTGRMNRSIDSRSDLYALGVTLYQMLTSTLPFTASEPMELVHCHIARRPVPPLALVKEIPSSISAIIMKLLAKTAEERYQTAAGLESDLRRCLSAWKAHGRIGDFPLGGHDTPDRLLIPEKLYGRTFEVETLIASFDRIVKSGAPELVVVSGYSGIGKSSVVNELHRVLVPPRGLFASGKFDQYKRDIPYSTLLQAFQSLVRSLLGKSDAELGGWRGAFLEALGPNGRLMADVVPELKLIIGDQPAIIELPPQDAQRRFQQVLRAFIGVFARPEHPLALFLDDLQWLDAGTLDLLEDLLTRSDLQQLMLIGAYRDNEVTATHPLMRKLDAIKSAGGKVTEITLAPLSREDLGQLIADALRCESDRSEPLAQLVHEKTGGNPFFAIQFIASLAEEGMLVFDHDAVSWSWNVDRMYAKRYTDNVVDLMIGKLTRLPIETQNGLQQLACLGSIADSTVLSLVLGTTEERLHEALWEAMRVELVERVGGAYRFVHDRVHEAAYSLVPEARRGEAHLRIGRVLAAHIPREKREEAIFEIVNQLNRGAALMTSREEREQLAELNLSAGRRARASTAYASALNYLVAGVAWVADEGWERRPDLMFTLELHRAECEFLTGDLMAAEARLTMLSSRAADAIDQAAVACLRVELYTTLDRSDRAVDVCLAYLRDLGIEWSPHPTEDEARQEYERTWSLLGTREIEGLIELPLMSDPVRRATLDVLTKVLPAAFFTDPQLFSLAVCRMVNLSLEHGNTDASCIGYVHLGVIAGPRFGNYGAGYRIGRLGYDLVEQRGLERFRARTCFCFGLVVVWKEHVRAGRDFLRLAFEAANATADLTYAFYCRVTLITNLLAAGDPLVDVEREAEQGLESAEKMRFGLVTDIISAQRGLVRTLRGVTQSFGCFNDERFDELQVEGRLASNPALAMAECWYWIRKLQARFFAGDYVSAVDASANALRLLWTSPSLLETAEAHFYGALSHAACCNGGLSAQYPDHVHALSAHYRQLMEWAEHCPENFGNRAALVGAEIARIEGRELDAERLYEQAIRSARENGFVHNEALANELAARFYATRGFETIAHAYLRKARYGYLRWGADGKVAQLEKLYPHLRMGEAAAVPGGTIRASVEHLDLATVLEVSQAVAGEIVLDKLVETLLRTALEHAGAERGLLILPRGGELLIQAEANTSGSSVTVSLRETLVSASELPESVVRYAARTQENVILDDAAAPNPFSSDRYIRARRARSVLCVPLVKQAALVALLYLENNLAAGVFTAGRITVLKMLASEAAMSLDRSRLYRELQEREARIRRLVDANIIGVVITDLDGPIIDANDAFLDMLGYSRDDLVTGRLRWSTVTPVEWHAATARAAAEIRATGRCATYEKEYIRKDGRRVSALVGGAAFEDTRSRAVAFVLDLSERKRSEEALQRARSELAHVTRVTTLGELAASIAHEVRQPLSAIAADAEACRNWLEAPNPRLDLVREALAAIAIDTHRAAEVIQRIRQLATKTEPRKGRVDVNEVVRDVVSLVSAELLRHEVTAVLELAAELPMVVGDPIQLRQVILNLAINAIEAMAPIGDRSRRLVIRSEGSAGDDVTIAVQDSGVGIGSDDLHRLFDPFFSTKPGGMGMGLSISRSIVEAHSGRLWATTSEPHGAIFHIRLPVGSAGVGGSVGLDTSSGVQSDDPPTRSRA